MYVCLHAQDLRWRVSLAVNSRGEVWRELNHNAGSYSYVIGHIKELLGKPRRRIVDLYDRRYLLAVHCLLRVCVHVS